MTRLTSKAAVVLLSVLALVMVLAATRAVWLTGTVDGVAGPVTAQALGTDASSGLPAIALVGPAAAVAAVTAGRVGRWVAVAAMAVGATAVIALSTRVVLSAETVLGQVAARASGATGAFEATADVTAMPWVAVAGGLVQVVAVGGAAVGGRRWGRLGGRYERVGTTDSEVSGPRGEVVDSDWDRLSRGEDPTGDDVPPSAAT